MRSVAIARRKDTEAEGVDRKRREGSACRWEGKGRTAQGSACRREGKARVGRPAIPESWLNPPTTNSHRPHVFPLLSQCQRARQGCRIYESQARGAPTSTRLPEEAPTSRRRKAPTTARRTAYNRQEDRQVAVQTGRSERASRAQGKSTKHCIGSQERDQARRRAQARRRDQARIPPSPHTARRGAYRIPQVEDQARGRDQARIPQERTERTQTAMPDTDSACRRQGRAAGKDTESSKTQWSSKKL